MPICHSSHSSGVAIVPSSPIPRMSLPPTALQKIDSNSQRPLVPHSGGTPLDALDSKQRLAVELYTNPLYGRTFGNKAASARAAGYTGSNAGSVLSRPVVQTAIAYTYTLRDMQAEDVSEHLRQFTKYAADKLVKQMGIDDGVDIHVMPEGLLDERPQPIMGKDKQGNDIIAGYDEGHLKQARAITDHNKAVASLARESRAAAQLVLAYLLGNPDAKVKGDRASIDSTALTKLSDEQAAALARMVDLELRSREAPKIIEAEIEDPGG